MNLGTNMVFFMKSKRRTKRTPKAEGLALLHCSKGRAVAVYVLRALNWLGGMFHHC